MSDFADVISRAEAWISHDPNEADRAALGQLMTRAADGDELARNELSDAMSGPLAFGTAGLRAAMGPGQNRMNTAVVTTASAGLAAVLRERAGTDFKVVVGFDGRHNSRDFALTAAGVFAAAGGQVFLMPRPLPTPLTAFAINHLDADAAVMVTASHNPAADNGYKVYVGGRVTDAVGRGAQIVPPLDAEIASAIERAGAADQVQVANDGWTVLGDQIVDAYVESTKSLVDSKIDSSGLTVVLTAMHGVGYQTAQRVLREAGVGKIVPVDAQREPDPDFPTVSFPNPEEAGALDLAMATARDHDADLIIALDPDADRCAVAVPDANNEQGWRQLSGDELGALLGEFLAQGLEKSGKTLARSLVSGSLLDSIAARHGLGQAQTLTGFKWIARTPDIGYGYEEAIGYCVNPDVVRDKDGISTALVVVQLAAQAKARGTTLPDMLDALYLTHGLHLTRPLTFRVEELALIDEGLQRLAANPPAELAGARVVEFADLSNGWRGLPPTTGFRIENENGDRVVVRPSGTEPKLKCYLEVVEQASTTLELERAKAKADARLQQITAELQQLIGL